MKTNKKVLIVDDDQLNLAIIGDKLSSSGYGIVTAPSGEEALRHAILGKPQVILLDIILPGMDGFTVCAKLKEFEDTRQIPVIMMTAVADKESKLRGLEAGAVEFLDKPVDLAELSIRLKNVIEIKEYHDYLKSYSSELENIVEERTAELRKSFIETMYRLTLMSEHKDRGTASHIKRVGHYTAFLARCLGLPDKEIDIMFHASPMHDIGKIGIPDKILQNKEKLTDEEFDILKRHTIIGGSVLAGSKSEYIKSAKRFALYHHEAWDGSGYPYGLVGSEIPIEGRIMMMADRYDAMRSERYYKGPMGHDEAMKIIVEGNEKSSPGHFDPQILELFKEHHLKFADIYEEHKDICSIIPKLLPDEE